MALGAVLAAALTDHSSHFYSIFIDGLDVVREPGASPRYAVPDSSISIDEQGPDGVSSMDFIIECTTALPITVNDGAEVRFDFSATSYRYFRGWVDHVDYENMPGDVGTRFKVRCTGIEAALDWCVMPNDVVIPAGTDPGVAVQTLAAQAAGTVLGLLNVAANGSGGSSQAFPVTTGIGGTVVTGNAITVTAGTTLREAIREVTAQTTNATSDLVATVDFWGGLRYYTASSGVNDSVSITVDDDPPVNGPGENTTYGIDASQVRAVVVKGTGVTVTVGDGSGKPGATAVLADSTLTTVAAATQAGQGYLRQYASAVRGQWTYTDYDGSATGIHAFMVNPSISDARLGLSSAFYRVTAISRTNFHGAGAGTVREDDTFSFGGTAPSVTRLTRQLTRTTLS